MKTILRRAALGFLIGMAMGNGISWIFGLADGGLADWSLVGRTGSLAGALALQTLVSGLYGAICFAGMSLYDIEAWPMLASAASHYLLIVLCYIPSALLLGWARGVQDLLLTAGIQLVGYVIVWFIIFLNYRAQVNKLNEIKNQNEDRDSQHSEGE